ncbi:MAG: zinc-containing ferredoxin [Candidatus Micrarchaeota archaeon]|nr:MAG: zinc-containing ferredoxin [Candidatus Micrarchaeota archaeon]
MPFQFTFDMERCIQCGICGDVCPVNTLDFTRPRHKNVESSKNYDTLTLDMTEYPIQVNRCIGCLICQEECPVQCITIKKVDKEPQYAPIQGPMLNEEPTEDTFQLSRYTKVRPFKVKVKDPWGKIYVYIPKRRKSVTQTWEEKDML